MIGFMVGVGVLMAVTLLLLLPPLMRGGSRAGGQRREALNLAVLRHQSRELAAEREAGLLGDEEYAQARDELERRVAEEVRPENVAVSTGSTRWTGIAVGTVLPLLAAALYLFLGSPMALVQERPIRTARRVRRAPRACPRKCCSRSNPWSQAWPSA